MGSFEPTTSDGGRSCCSLGKRLRTFISSGPLLVAFVGSYAAKIALSKLEEKNFRRVVLVLVFLIGLTTLGKFVEQISR
ncbi:MAG: hypothetical protein DMC59_07920 [Verrucomicrobia bacterium]|nr:MAG: hypothetical protein DMC59_07920 [Verrucomicrobiota bacterium]